MSAGVAPAGLPGMAPAHHHRYITDSLLVVMNPRRIPECVTAFEALPLDVAYVRGCNEPDALRNITRIIRAGGYQRYLITSDDVIVTTEAVRAVIETSRMNRARLVTGFCNLDLDSPLVNITKRPLRGDTPHPDAYDFYRRDELPAHGTVPSGFAGLALTCITSHLASRLLPLGWYGTGWASDFHLSKNCERQGIRIVAPATAFVWHVKERWNEADRDPAKRLLIGTPELLIQRKGVTVPMTLTTPRPKGGTYSMSEKIAEQDITRVNDLGQNVLLVPAGQPIPDDLDLTGSSADTKKVSAPTENKARKQPKASKSK